MQQNNVSIWRDAQRLLVLTEEAVRRFPRYHKYALGSDLRHQARWIGQLVNRAWRDQPRRLRHVEQLVFAVDDMKLLLQTGKEIRAFASFAQFQQLSELTVGLGKQSGGWRRRLSARPEAPSQ